MARMGVPLNRRKLKAAIVKGKGYSAEICKIANCHISTFHKYIRQDVELAILLDETREVRNAEDDGRDYELEELAFKIAEQLLEKKDATMAAKFLDRQERRRRMEKQHAKEVRDRIAAAEAASRQEVHTLSMPGLDG